MIAWAADGRRQRLDPDAAAGAAPARCSAPPPVARATSRGLRRPGRARGRAGRPAGRAAAAWSRWPTPAALTKADMPNNDALPGIVVDPDCFTVSIDGEVDRAERRRRAAHGPALLPVLMMRRNAPAPWRCCSPTPACPTAATPTRAVSEQAVDDGVVTDLPTLAAFLGGRLVAPAALSAHAAAGRAPLAAQRRPGGAGPWTVLDAEVERPHRLAGCAGRQAGPGPGPAAAAGRRVLGAAARRRWPRRARRPACGRSPWAPSAPAAGWRRRDAAPGRRLRRRSAVRPGPPLRLLGLDPVRGGRASWPVWRRRSTAMAAEATPTWRRGPDAARLCPPPAAPLTDFGAEHHAAWEERLFAS